jgi:hypothetical protein
MEQISLIIADYRISIEAQERLWEMGDLLLFQHESVVGALSGHPDISIFHNGKNIIVSADIPAHVCNALKKHDIKYQQAGEVSGPDHPYSATFNASGTENVLIHNIKFTAVPVLDLYPGKEIIDVKQGYARCSTLLLDDNHLITSDVGIAGKCRASGKDVLLVSPGDIVLPGMEYGLFGGCCGIINDTVVIYGSLQYHPQGSEIQNYIHKCGLKIFELVDEPLQDVGGIFIF